MPSAGKTTLLRRRWLRALIGCVFFFLILYLIVRWGFWATAQFDAVERVAAFLFLSAETFVLFQALGYYRAIRTSTYEADLPRVPLPPNPPTVAILIPARHEPKEVLRQTLLSATKQDYPNVHVYFLDDSSDPQYLKEADELVAEFGVRHFRRKERHGAKAGVLNDIIKTLDEPYIAVLDADQKPISTFLSRLVPALEADPKVAFIQTPQFYTNATSSRVAHAANMQQAVFYEYVCEGKNGADAMFCCGTNVLFRREALLDVGGFDETSVTEDFATSIKLQVKGWRALYDNHVAVFGMAPEDIDGYFKQQFRWAKGNMSVLRVLVREFIKNPSAMRPGQWFEYFITSCYYFIGWAYVILMMGPVVYLIANIPSYNLNAYGYSATFLPYMILSTWIHWSQMQSRHYEFRKLLMGQLLFFITLPVYMQATLYGILGVKTSFQVTGKGGGKQASYLVFWPQILLWTVLLVALTWGVLRIYHERSVPVLLNTFWTMIHFFALSSVFYFNESDDASERKAKKVAADVKFDYQMVREENKPPAYDPADLERCFWVRSERTAGIGSRIMCRLRRAHDNLVFDAEVIDSIPSGIPFVNDRRLILRPTGVPAESEKRLYEEYLQ